MTNLAFTTCRHRTPAAPGAVVAALLCLAAGCAAQPAPPKARGSTGAAAEAAVTPASPVSAAPQPRPQPGPTPPSVVENWEALVGTWVADNSAYKSESDPWEAFGLEWRWGLGRRGLAGRLYGIRNGKDGGTFWEFREFWHPGEGRVVAMQLGGDGTYGVGYRETRPDGTDELLQTFYAPDGSQSRTGHRARRDGGTQTSTSFEVSPAGEWKERRTYVWKKQ